MVASLFFSVGGYLRFAGVANSNHFSAKLTLFKKPGKENMAPFKLHLIPDAEARKLRSLQEKGAPDY
jgi:hypothetical protein